MLSPRFAKVVVSVLCTFPAIDILRKLYAHNPNFVRDYDFLALKFAINQTGAWAFIMLFLVLACTPVQRVAKTAWIPALRRPLGLATFGYFVLHFLAYFVVGQKLNVQFVYEDAMLEPSRLPGWGSLLLLVPLALTSTDGMLRGLGGKRWKRLHRLVYPAGALAVLHVYLIDVAHRSDFQDTKLVLVPFAVLMLVRLWPRKRTPRPST